MNDRDSDSLAEEAREMPNVVQVITGRFPRNPPLFYQMRIARVQEELKTNPRDFNLYDDIAVALDRPGGDDEAISWIERKRVWLPPFNTHNRVLKEHWYRYHANCGTFWAHRWLRNGANRKRISEMIHARDHIARAIQIKPNAHFGREKYQMMAMNWIIHWPKIKDGRLPTFVNEEEENTEALAAQVKGLSGLVVLGNAWESVDMFNAIKTTLQPQRRMALAYLAQLRCSELIKKGKRSLVPGAGKFDQEKLISKRSHRTIRFTDQKEVESAYKTLRAEAETWQRTRTSYMMSRLKQGRHPDTDKTFWDEYSNSAPPSLKQLTPRNTPRWWRAFFSDPTRITYIIGFALLGTFIFLPVLLLRALRKRS